METRTLVVALVAILNNAAEELEKVLAADGDAEETTTSTRGSKKKAAVKPKAKAKDEDEEEEEEETEDGDEPSEDDVIDAVKAAQKVLEKPAIAKILMKYGKAARASEVEPENRQRVIDALEKAVEDAE